MTPFNNFKKIFILVIPAVIFFGFNIGSVFAANTVNGLVGHWTLDKSVGSTTPDVSGAGNNMELFNNPVLINTGYKNKALAFSGGDDYMKASSLDNAKFPTSGSLSLWINADYNQNYTSIFDSYSRKRNHIFIRTADTYSCTGNPGIQISFQPISSPYVFVRDLCGLSSNHWNNVVVSWDTINNKGDIYLNGSLVYSATITDTSWVPDKQSFIFGGGAFKGNLDDVRLYNRPLSGSDVFNIYTNGKVGTSASNNWYSRPLGSCAYSGNGMSYSCASAPGGNGAFVGNSRISFSPVTGVDDGDTLYICGKHISDALNFLPGVSGTKNNPISVNFDCPGDPGSIRMITNMTDAANPSDWINESPNVWYYSVNNYSVKIPRRVWVDGVEKIPAVSKTDLGKSYKGGPVSNWWYDSVNNRLYYYSTVDPANTFTKMESLVQKNNKKGSCFNSAICFVDNTVNYINVINPKLYGGGIFTVIDNGGSHINIYGTNPNKTSCIISLNKELIFIRNDLNGNPAQYNSVHNCTIDTAYTSNFSGYANFLGGDAIRIYGGSKNHIYNNTIKNSGHTAVYIISNTKLGIQSSDNLVENNLIKMDPDLLIYGRGISVDGRSNTPANNNIFRQNIIDGWTVRSQINGTNSKVLNNIFKNQRAEPVNSPPRSDMLSFQGYTGPSNGHVIANNLFLNDPYGPCLDFISNPADSLKHNITIANNILQNCHDNMWHSKSALYVIDTSVLNNSIKNNIIHNSNTSALPVYYRGTSYSVSGFQKACSSGDTCSGNISGNPLFISSSNFSPQQFSPLIDSGISIAGRTTDILGNPIYGTPDIGPYEYQPPYTIGTNNPSADASIRIYANGKYRYLSAASTASTADINVTPIGGFSQNDYKQYMDITINEWNTTGTNERMWAESLPIAITTVHTIGDLKSNTHYIVTVDGTPYVNKSTNSSGQLIFNYVKEYATHVFSLIEDTVISTQPKTDYASTKTTKSKLPDTNISTLKHSTQSSVATSTTSVTVKAPQKSAIKKLPTPDARAVLVRNLQTQIISALEQLITLLKKEIASALLAR